VRRFYLVEFHDDSSVPTANKTDVSDLTDKRCQSSAHSPVRILQQIEDDESVLIQYVPSRVSDLRGQGFLGRE
jgi:hypothetical protein